LRMLWSEDLLVTEDIGNSKRPYLAIVTKSSTAL
jgi:hypothetical protein